MLLASLDNWRPSAIDVYAPSVISSFHRMRLLLLIERGDVILGFYLIYALRRKLHVDCPLCYTAHVINVLLFVLLIDFVTLSYDLRFEVRASCPFSSQGGSLMKTHPSFSVRSLLLLLLLCPTLTLGQELKPLILPAPQTDGGKPLMQALKDRHSTREFSSEKLSPQVLANLLWAAFGINRPGHRQADGAFRDELAGD